MALALIAPVECALAAGASPTAAAWAARIWRSDDGLPNNHVTGLAHTADGYLWVATYAAPARFDGVRFEEYLPKDLGLGSNQKIAAITPARSGGLWLGTIHGGVVRLDGHRAELFSEGLPYKPVQGLVEDATGALWITHQGGTVFRLREGRLTAFDAKDGVPAADSPSRYVCSLATDVHGRLWFSKDGQVGVFRDGRFVTLLQLNPINARLGQASDGGMWICSAGQLFKFAEGRPLVRLGAFERKPGTHATAVLEDADGHVWIGTTDRGLFHYDGTAIRPVPTSDPRITSLAQDRKGNVWVGTVGGGLNRLRPRIVALESLGAGATADIVQSLAEDAAGRVWATTLNGALLRRKPEGGWTNVSNEHGWPGGRASCVTTDANGAVWIGTRDFTLYRWKEDAFTAWRKADGLIGRETHALAAGRNGDLWIGMSTPVAVQRLRNGQLESYRMLPGIRVIRALAEDRAGNAWVGTSDGRLLRIRDGVVVDETRRTSGTPLSIRCLRATPDGALWIGYADEGIGWWKDGRFARVPAELGLPEHNVSQIIPDDAGWLWFAGDHGIFKTRQAALEAVALGDPTRAHFIRFGQSEGLFSLEANFGDSPGALRTRDGRLWIPMRTTLAIVDPRRAHEDTEPPVILVKHVVVDDHLAAAYGGSVPVGDAIDLSDDGGRLRLSAGHHRLAFEFAALSYGAPENVRFRYQLEGFDDHWIDAGAQRVANYSRLTAGPYRFRVQGCNSDGVWNERGATVTLVVAPFWWQTWWCRTLALAGLIAAIAGGARVVLLRRVHERLRLLEQQAMLNKERSRIARDLHDEFGTRLTELGLLAELENRRPCAPAATDRSELLVHIRALERDLDTIVWAVNPQNDTLDQLIGFVCRVSSEFLSCSSIRCRFEIPDELPACALSPEARHHLFLVVREALNNVVKHARASLVRLAIELEHGMLRVRIVDDGRGFALETATATGARNGLRNMRARLEELGGTLHLDTAPGRGTTVTFHVPLAEAAGSPRADIHAAPHPSAAEHAVPAS